MHRLLLQLFDRGERCAVQRLALKDGKPSLDPIEPRRPRRGDAAAWNARQQSCRWRLRALQTRSWCRAACNRGSGRSRRVRSGASFAPAPTPGSKASHRHREQSPWQAGRYRDRPRRPLSPRTQGHCSRTRTCGQPDRCCARAESAKHIERQHLATPSPAADPSSARSPAAAAYPEAPECVYSSPDCRLASCLPAGDHSVQQARDRQSDAAIC